jgi:ectoine hydroxylase-related dioxygenase (phytanoyl-CoA dioxygenase family)
MLFGCRTNTMGVTVYDLTRDALASFERDGYAVINELIAPEEVDRLRGILMNLHEKKIGFKEGALFDAAGTDEEGKEPVFPQITNARMYAPELEKSEYFKAGLRIAQAVLGPNAQLKADITFLKPPFIGSDTPWHQDEAFGNPLYDYEQLSIWLALTAANASNSCMSFIPGSHLLEVLEHQPLGGDPRIHALECIGKFDASTAIECPLEAGSCTLHGGRTLHYAGPNHSAQGRLAYVIIFDTPPVLRKTAREFSWSKDRQKTVRAQREQQWRQDHGVLVYLWRKRKQLRLSRGVSELRRVGKAIVNAVQGR